MITPKKNIIKLILILCLIAFINAGYLTYQAFVETQSPSCARGERFSCSSVLSHPASWIMGVPFPAIALIVYPLLGYLVYVSYKKKNLTALKRVVRLSGSGVAFNAYIIWIEATIIKKFCPLCMLCTLIIITIFVLSQYLLRHKDPLT